MLSHTLTEAAIRVLSAMFGGEAAGFTREQADKMRAADTPEWNQALRYARAAITGIASDAAL